MLKKLSIVFLAVCITVGAAAYPASVYLGNKIYEQYVSYVLAKDPALKIQEVSKSYSTRVANVEYELENLGTLYLVAETEFELLGSHTELKFDFSKGVLAEAKEQLNIEKEPKIISYIDYSLLKDKFLGNVKTEPLVFSVSQQNSGSLFTTTCELGDMSIESSVDRDALYINTVDKALDYISTGKTTTEIEYILPNLHCSYSEIGSSESIEWSLSGIKLTNQAVSVYPIGSNTITFNKIALNAPSFKVNLDNLMFNTDTLVGENNTFGNKFVSKADSIEIIYPNAQTEEDKIIKVSEQNIDITLGGIPRVNYVELLNYYNKENESNITEIFDKMPFVLELSNISGLINNGKFKINGRMLKPSSSFLDFAQNSVVLNVNLDKSLLDLFEVRREAEALMSQGYIEDIGDSLHFEIRFEKGQLTSNNKKLSLF